MNALARKKEADVILERRYTVGVQAHNTMETHGTVCRWEGDKLTIWTSTKGIWAVLDIVCTIMGLPETSVEVNAPYVGGKPARPRPCKRSSARPFRKRSEGLSGCSSQGRRGSPSLITAWAPFTTISRQV